MSFPNRGREASGGEGAALRSDVASAGSRLRSRIHRLRGSAGVEWLNSLSTAAALGVVTSLAAWIHGILPGLTPDMSAHLFRGAASICAADGGLISNALTGQCDLYGAPAGAPAQTGGPTAFFGGVLIALTGLSPLAAASIVLFGLLVIGVLAAFLLARSLGISRPWAVFAAAAYFFAPTALGLAPFVGVHDGALLLPAYILVTFALWTSVQARRRRSVFGAAYVLTSCLALTMDGYTFLMFLLVGFCVAAVAPFATSQRADRLRVGTTLAGTMVLSWAAAAGYYSLRGGGDFPQESVDVFRSMGADLATLLWPSPAQWWAGDLALDPARLWGDGTNASHNYLGLVLVALAISAVVMRRNSRVLIVALVTGISLVLALGPAIKIADQQPEPSGAVPTYSSYFMPSSEATLPLPWAQAFVATPGLQGARASYRWLTLTRLGLALLAAIALLETWRRLPKRARAVVPLVGILAIAEIAPNVGALHDRYSANTRQLDALERDLIVPLRVALEPGERVLYATPGLGYNDYLANWVAARTMAPSFNVGGDKNVVAASAVWPASVRDVLFADRPTSALIETALEDEAVDVVVLLPFDLRVAAYAWPPVGVTPADRAWQQDALENLTRVRAGAVGEYATVVRRSAVSR